MAASSTLPPALPGTAVPRIRRWVSIWLAVVSGILVVGTLGYVVLFGWSLSDAVYMTVITLTTVG